MGMKRFLLVVSLIVVLSLAACTRSASQSPTGDQTPGTGEEVPFPTPGAEGTPDMMSTLLAGGFATQTAQAQGEPVQVTPEPGVATATPEVSVPTNTPTSEATATTAPTATPESEPVSACESPYTVAAGEWVYSIARKCGLDPQDIINANGLVAPYLLYPGDELDLPEASTTPGASPGGSCESPYTVSAGEWVYSIARKCNVTPESIISANNLSFPYTIFPGEELTIP